MPHTKLIGNYWGVNKMAYESIALILSTLSTIILFIGLIFTNKLRIKTAKASAIWPIIFFAFLTLFLYQIAEVGEYADKLAGEPTGGFHLVFEQTLGMTIHDFAEGFRHTMPMAAAAILVCLGIVLRKSILLPI